MMNTVFKKFTTLSIVIFFVLPLLGCKKEANVSVSCGNLGSYKGSIGHLNIPSFDLGNIIYFNTTTKNAFYLSTASFNASSVLSAPKMDLMIDKYKLEIDVSFDVEIPDAVQAKIKSNIQKLTKIEVTNYIRKYVNDPMSKRQPKIDPLR